MTVVPRPRTVSPVSTAGPVPGPVSTNDSESDVWPGVASTRSSQPAAATTSPSPSASEPSTSDGSSARTGAPVSPAKRRAPAAWSWWRWVSRTSVTGPCPAASSRCSGWSSPGSTITHPSSPGARSTQVLVPSSVMGEGLGASSTDASGVTGRSSP